MQALTYEEAKEQGVYAYRYDLQRWAYWKDGTQNLVYIIDGKPTEPLGIPRKTRRMRTWIFDEKLKYTLTFLKRCNPPSLYGGWRGRRTQIN